MSYNPALVRGPARVGEGCRARISDLSADAAAWAWGRGAVVGRGGVDIVVRQMNFVYDIRYE